MRLAEEAALNIRANVDVWGFPADAVPTFEDYLRLKQKGELREVAIYHDRGHNLAVNAGLNQLGNLLIGANTSYASHCGVGSSTTAAAAGQTDLQTPISPRVSIPSGGRYLGTNTGEAHLDTFFGSSDNAGSWNETGLFTAASSGTMYCRRVLAATFTKSTANTAVVAWTITFAAV